MATAPSSSAGGDEAHPTLWPDANTAWSDFYNCLSVDVQQTIGIALTISYQVLRCAVVLWLGLVLLGGMYLCVFLYALNSKLMLLHVRILRGVFDVTEAGVGEKKSVVESEQQLSENGIKELVHEPSAFGHNALAALEVKVTANQKSNHAMRYEDDENTTRAEHMRLDIEEKRKQEKAFVTWGTFEAEDGSAYEASTIVPGAETWQANFQNKVLALENSFVGSPHIISQRLTSDETARATGADVDRNGMEPLLALTNASDRENFSPPQAISRRSADAFELNVDQLATAAEFQASTTRGRASRQTTLETRSKITKRSSTSPNHHGSALPPPSLPQSKTQPMKPKPPPAGTLPPHLRRAREARERKSAEDNNDSVEDGAPHGRFAATQLVVTPADSRPASEEASRKLEMTEAFQPSQSPKILGNGTPSPPFPSSSEHDAAVQSAVAALELQAHNKRTLNRDLSLLELPQPTVKILPTQSLLKHQYESPPPDQRRQGSKALGDYQQPSLLDQCDRGIQALGSHHQDLIGLFFVEFTDQSPTDTSGDLTPKPSEVNSSSQAASREASNSPTKSATSNSFTEPEVAVFAPASSAEPVLSPRRSSQIATFSSLPSTSDPDHPLLPMSATLATIAPPKAPPGFGWEASFDSLVLTPEWQTADTAEASPDQQHPVISKVKAHRLEENKQKFASLLRAKAPANQGSRSAQIKDLKKWHDDFQLVDDAKGVKKNLAGFAVDLDNISLAAQSFNVPGETVDKPPTSLRFGAKGCGEEEEPKTDHGNSLSALTECLKCTATVGKSEDSTSQEEYPALHGGHKVLQSVDTTKDGKRQRKQVREVARMSLREAWKDRERARLHVLGSYSLKHMQSLEKTTLAYREKRSELQRCMATCVLNDEDARIYPPLGTTDLRAPKYKPPGVSLAKTTPKKESPAPPPAMRQGDDQFHLLRDLVEKAYKNYQAAVHDRDFPTAGDAGRAQPKKIHAKAEAKVARAYAYYLKKVSILKAANSVDTFRPSGNTGGTQ